MNKKIIALAVAIILMVTCFTACKTRHKKLEINGKEEYVVTDADGKVYINDENQIAVYVTDDQGEIITFESGEEQTYYIQIKDPIEIDGAVHSNLFKFELIDGWEAGEGDRINKKGVKDNHCYIRCFKVAEMNDENSFKKHLEGLDEQNSQFAKAFEGTENTLTIEKGNGPIATQGYASESRTYKIVDANGKVIHFAVNYYFVVEDVIYEASYICENGDGYDESFDYYTYFKTGFAFVENNKK